MSFDECRVCVPPKRHSGCHDTCPDYIKRKAEWDENKKKIWENKKKEKEIGGYKINATRKARKKIRLSKNNK